MLIVFRDMIADIVFNKTDIPMVTELFLRGKKINMSLVFTTKASKCVKL